MNKITKIYICILVLLFAGGVIFELSRPAPVDWTPTFNEKHTIPYGLKIFNEELAALFPHNETIHIRTSLYEYFNSNFSWDELKYTVSGNYLFINNDFNVDQISIEKLLHFVSEGNNAFISTGFYPKMLQDSLNFEIQYDYGITGKGRMSLANASFKKDSITLERNFNATYFSQLDSKRTIVLGYQNKKENNINFVKISHGTGNFYLHTQPYVFTNYHLLKNNQHRYAAGVLSYLPDATIFFDSANKIRNEVGSSPLRYVFSQPALKWAWYLSLLTLVTFMIFNAKRKQRIIKVIKPLRNTTVDFTKTIANLYYETKAHNNIIDKKITHFLERIRSDYYLDTDVLDEKFIKNLSLKSGNDKDDVDRLINFIKYLQRKENCTEDNLLDLNELIENFYRRK